MSCTATDAPALSSHSTPLSQTLRISSGSSFTKYSCGTPTRTPVRSTLVDSDDCSIVSLHCSPQHHTHHQSVSTLHDSQPSQTPSTQSPAHPVRRHFFTHTGRILLVRTSDRFENNRGVAAWSTYRGHTSFFRPHQRAADSPNVPDSSGEDAWGIKRTGVRDHPVARHSAVRRLQSHNTAVRCRLCMYTQCVSDDIDANDVAAPVSARRTCRTEPPVSEPRAAKQQPAATAAALPPELPPATTASSSKFTDHGLIVAPNLV